MTDLKDMLYVHAL